MCNTRISLTANRLRSSSSEPGSLLVDLNRDVIMHEFEVPAVVGSVRNDGAMRFG